MELLLGAIIAVLSFFLGAVFRPYLTGYGTKKGENLATHEDIDKLVDQVKAVTEAAKKDRGGNVEWGVGQAETLGDEARGVV